MKVLLKRRKYKKYINIKFKKKLFQGTTLEEFRVFDERGFIILPKCNRS